MKVATHLLRIRGHTIWAAQLTPESVVVDTGAHRGEFSRALRDRFSCRCHLVEASAKLAAQLQQENFVSVVAAALASRDGAAVFFNRQNSESGGIFARACAGTATLERVETLTLQTLMRRLALSHIDLLKLDIEGAEFDLLQTLPPGVLDSIGQISVEFHDFLPEFKGRGLYESVKRRLQSLGFVACRMTFRTHGDVLFLNRKIVPLRATARLWLQHVARWTMRLKSQSGAA